MMELWSLLCLNFSKGPRRKLRLCILSKLRWPRVGNRGSPTSDPCHCSEKSSETKGNIYWLPSYLPIKYKRHLVRKRYLVRCIQIFMLRSLFTCLILILKRLFGFSISLNKTKWLTYRWFSLETNGLGV